MLLLHPVNLRNLLGKVGLHPKRGLICRVGKGGHGPGQLGSEEKTQGLWLGLCGLLGSEGSFLCSLCTSQDDQHFSPGDARAASSFPVELLSTTADSGLWGAEL